MEAGVFTTNDVPGCPKGGLLSGTDKADIWTARMAMTRYMALAV